MSSDTVPVLFVDWVDATRVRVSQSDGAASMFDLETGRRRRVQSPAGFELIGAKVDTYLWRGTTDGAVLARDSTGRDLARAPIANQIASATAGDGSRVVLVGAAEDGGRQMSMFTRSAASWSTPRTLTPSDLWPAGIRGDGTVYWSRFTGQTEVWRSLGNAQPTRVATLPVHCYAQSVAVSEDGATLICNLTTQQPDAWLLQLPKP